MRRLPACARAPLQDADLLDAGAVFATGFAPFRGGPLQYAKQRGIAIVTRRLTNSRSATASASARMPAGSLFLLDSSVSVNHCVAAAGGVLW